jgi:hypothetical protein
MWVDYSNHRTLVTLSGLVRLKLRIRRCPHPECSRYHRPYRPEAEGVLALPQHEVGLDVIALVGALRYGEHQSVPEIHRHLRERGVAIAERTVTYLLERYEELLALSLADPERLREVTAREGRVILALDGLQPDVGHEVLWLLRDCLSGEVLLARSLLSATAEDLAALLTSVVQMLTVPVVAVLSDGQHSIRRAVAQALPGVPHQLCHFHYLRAAARPSYACDCRLQPGDDLLGALRVRALQGSAGHDPLQTLGHVHPASAQRRVQECDALGEVPEDELAALVAGQVIEDQEHAQPGQRLRQRGAKAQPLLPALPLGADLLLRGRALTRGQRREDLAELLPEPGVQHRVCTALEPPSPAPALWPDERG